MTNNQRMLALLFAAGFLCSPCCTAAEIPSNPIPSQTLPKSWKVSLGALAAAEAADLLSSRGHYEANPLAQGPGGVFSTQRGIAIKVSLIGPLVVAQWLALRGSRLSPKASRLAKVFTWMNLGAAVGTGAIAWHNTRVAGIRQ